MLSFRQYKKTKNKKTSSTVGSSHLPKGKSMGCSSANFLMDWPSEPRKSRRERPGPRASPPDGGQGNARREKGVLSATGVASKSSGHGGRKCWFWCWRVTAMVSNMVSESNTYGVESNHYGFKE
jgi:hypothetical protein